MLARIALGMLGFLAVAFSAVAQTASPNPWLPIGNTVSLSASNSSTRVQLGWVSLQPNAPTTAYVCNTGTVAANVAFGTVAVVATTNNFQIPANSAGGLPPCVLLALNGGAYMAGITASSTTTLTVSTGYGSPLGGLGPGVSSPLLIVETSSKAASPYNVLASDVGTHFNNIGATGSVSFNLPAAAAGLNYCFGVDAAQTVNIVAATNEKIAYGTVNSAASGNLTSNQINSTLCVESHQTSQWVVSEGKGTWTVN